MVTTAKSKIFLLVAAAFLLVSASIDIAFTLMQEHSIENASLNNVRNFQQQFNNITDRDGMALGAMAQAIMVDAADIRTAWLSKDRDALYKAALPVFEALKRSFNITHFYFTDIDRVNFLRVHNPDSYGDRIERKTMLGAARSGKPFYGLEIGQFGTFTLRHVSPWYFDGQLIGYIELGKEAEYIFHSVHDVTKVDFIAAVDKQKLDRLQWVSGMRMFDHDAHWDRFEKMAVISDSLVTIPVELAGLMDMNVPLPEHYHLHDMLPINGREFFVEIQPLRDVGGEMIGRQFILSDQTGEVSRKNRIVMIVIAFSLVVGLVLFKLFHYMFDKLLRSQQQLHEANRVKSDFLANMSHEIRTPMNAIIGMSELALQSGLNPRQSNYIDKVHRSAVSLLGIINDILDFSKIEAGKMQMEQIDFHLDDVLDNLASVLSLRAEEKGIELMFEVDADVPEALIGDPLRLTQVLTNLLNNAVKFTDSGGEVLLHIRKTASEQGRVKLDFAVSDNGIGISAADQENLFKSFSQADTSTTRKYGGSGLGLAICKRIVDLMHGDIRVKSEPGVGSIFSFAVPFALDEANPGMQRDTLDDLHIERVLVVDDNATSREILAATLGMYGIQVDQAESGTEAMQKLKAADSVDAYDLILMDWMMPEMDGIQTAYHIQNDLKLEHVPTVMMVTAYGREEARIASDGVVFSDYLAKPVTSKALLNAIMRVFTGPSNKQDMGNNRSMSAADALIKLKGARILLVEDNEINQELATELLQANGMLVELAENGQEALDALAKHDFDGVLMDCQMPVMDGYEATRLIRENPACEALPIIAMTAHALANERKKVLQVGMNDCITKPVNVSTMFNTMAKWITPALSGSDAADHQLAGEVESLPPQLGDLPGIDVHAAMERVMGNETLYRKLLVKFVNNYSHFEAKLQQSIVSENDVGSAIRSVHTLKGVAGNIGANDLHAAALALEMVLKGEDDAIARQAALSELFAELNKVLAVLSRVA